MAIRWNWTNRWDRRNRSNKWNMRNRTNRWNRTNIRHKGEVKLTMIPKYENWHRYPCTWPILSTAPMGCKWTLEETEKIWCDVWRMTSSSLIAFEFLDFSAVEDNFSSSLGLAEPFKVKCLSSINPSQYFLQYLHYYIQLHLSYNNYFILIYYL